MKHGTLWRGEQPLCPRAELTERARERMRGLLGRASLDAAQALWITSCNAVHTLGMRMPIDVVFVDGEGTVLAVHANVARGRFRAHWRARATVELAAGRAAALALRAGDRLRFAEAGVRDGEAAA